MNDSAREIAAAGNLVRNIHHLIGDPCTSAPVYFSNKKSVSTRWGREGPMWLKIGTVRYKRTPEWHFGLR